MIRQRGGEAAVWVSGPAKQDLMETIVAARYAIAVVGEIVMISMYPPDSQNPIEIFLAALEEATERNPKAPNWEGLEHGGALRISDKGVIKTAEYTQWLAERQRTEYKTLENARKLREEKAALAKGKRKDYAG